MRYIGEENEIRRNLETFVIKKEQAADGILECVFRGVYNVLTDQRRYVEGIYGFVVAVYPNGKVEITHEDYKEIITMEIPLVAWTQIQAFVQESLLKLGIEA